MLTRVAAIDMELGQAECAHHTDDCAFDIVRAQVLEFLASAEEAANRKTPWGSLGYWRGDDPDHAWLAVHAAEEALLPEQDDDVLRGKAPTVVAWGTQTLGLQDKRVEQVSDLFKQQSTAPEEIPKRTKQLLKALLRSANDASDSSYASSRSFRNMVAVATGVAAVIGVLVAVFGIWWASAYPLCAGRICPTTGHTHATVLDVAAVELYGVLGAVLAVALSLRRLRGTRNPYGIGLVQGLLKIPLGALTALTGVLIVQSGLVAGVVKPASSSQVVAYAIVFGYAQQLLTTLVDKQALAVVHETSGERTTSKT